MSTLSNVDYFLEKATKFVKTDGGYIGYVDMPGRKYPPCEVSTKELDEINPHLPVLLDLLIEKASKTFYRGWAGLSLRATINHWKQPGPLLPNSKEKRVMLIAKASLLEYSRKLEISGTIYTEARHDLGFDYVTTIKADKVLVPYDWAEEHWPGVVGKLKAAQHLDYNAFQAAQVAFYDDAPNATPVDLNSISF